MALETHVLAGVTVSRRPVASPGIGVGCVEIAPVETLGPSKVLTPSRSDNRLSDDRCFSGCEALGDELAIPVGRFRLNFLGARAECRPRFPRGPVESHCGDALEAMSRNVHSRQGRCEPVEVARSAVSSDPPLIESLEQSLHLT